MGRKNKSRSKTKDINGEDGDSNEATSPQTPQTTPVVREKGSPPDAFTCASLGIQGGLSASARGSPAVGAADGSAQTPLLDKPASASGDKLAVYNGCNNKGIAACICGLATGVLGLIVWVAIHGGDL